MTKKNIEPWRAFRSSVGRKKKPQEMALITSTRNERNELYTIFTILYLKIGLCFFCIIPPISSNNENNNNASRPTLGCVLKLTTFGQRVYNETVKKRARTQADVHAHSQYDSEKKTCWIILRTLRFIFCCAFVTAG